MSKMLNIISFLLLSASNLKESPDFLSRENIHLKLWDAYCMDLNNFDILNIDLLKPYKIKANLFKKEWKDDFIPERNFSISTIDQLFSDEPYKLPNK